MSFGDGDLHVANRRLREHIARLEDKVDSLKDVNGDLCREINRQERRIRRLEALVRDMYGYAVNREMELCNACTDANGDYADCAACDDYDGACGIAKQRFEELYGDCVAELGIEVES